VQRKLGFILDKIHIDSAKLYKSVKKHQSYSRFTKESKKFNAKWRLYYDDKLLNRVEIF